MSERKPLILVVEDEPHVSGMVRDFLLHDGYDVVEAADGHTALQAVSRRRPDLILLDIVLPGLDGLSVCREVRKLSNVPIIMASSRVEELDRLLGLELGADDYICKPFSPREVVARVRAVLRRVNTPADENRDGPLLEIDKAAQRARIGGQTLDLTPTEFRVLRLLASHPGRVYSRSQILEMAYDDDQEVSDRVVDSHIKNIRRKIAQKAPENELIHSVYGIGYRYES
ncbi:MAG: response regulator [Magnetococcales bacterium]|nr:response regulator [Magnetococcales bacterium]